MEEILEYDGNISQICMWVHELLEYQFTVVHRTYKMMVDVDTLSRHFGPLISQHCAIAHILHGVDLNNRLEVYGHSKFADKGRTKFKRTDDNNPIKLSIIIQPDIDKTTYVPCTEDQIVMYKSPPLNKYSCSVLVTSVNASTCVGKIAKETLFRIMEVQESLYINCISINDVSGYLL